LKGIAAIFITTRLEAKIILVKKFGIRVCLETAITYPVAASLLTLTVIYRER
jgi:hypothetical protein